MLGLALADFCRYPRSSDSLRESENREIADDFADFPSAKFYDISTQQRRSVRRWKLSEQNFENFTIMGRFLKKCKNGSQNFQVLLLQAVITQQWLQIVGNSRPNWQSTGRLVSIFKVIINSKSLPWSVRSAPKRTPPHNFFRDFRIITVRSVSRTQPITIEYSVTWHYASSNAVSKKLVSHVRTLKQN